MELRLIADTNLFFECSALGDLPWHELGADSVVVLLTRPVMAEIDKHKNGSGRTKRRALAINQQVRGLLGGAETDLVVCAAGPRVVLRLAPIIRLPDDLRDDLDYTKNDDRLIGILATLSRAEKGELLLRTELFTDDTGANATARALGLPYRPIPGHWKRADEETDEARQVRDLTRQVAELKAQEPAVAIEHEGGETVEIVRRVARALSADEVDELVKRLQVRHPMRTDFTPPPPEPSVQIGNMEIPPSYVLESPDEVLVRRYQDESYPAWVAKCREVLSHLHEDRDEPEAPLRLRWLLRNDGSRPATRVRVEFEAEGPLALLRPTSVNHEDEEETQGQPASMAGRTLPHPPTPPAFKKVATVSPTTQPMGTDLATIDPRKLATSALAGMMPARDAMTSALSSLEAARLSGALDHLGLASEAARLLPDYERLMGRPSMWDTGMSAATMRSLLEPTPMSFDPSRLVPRPRDPEEFRYDGWRPSEPVQRGALTCDLWRHKVEPEPFDMEVVFEAEGATGGRVRCTVHAENLSRPAEASLAVRRRIEAVSLLEEGQRMVEGCG